MNSKIENYDIVKVIHKFDKMILYTLRNKPYKEVKLGEIYFKDNLGIFRKNIVEDSLLNKMEGLNSEHPLVLIEMVEEVYKTYEKQLRE